jgi:hypothetical protein
MSSTQSLALAKAGEPLSQLCPFPFAKILNLGLKELGEVWQKKGMPINAL